MCKNKKECFGVLDNVFPMGQDGLRTIVPECFDCLQKKECLQSALKTKQGLRFREKVLDRNHPGGLLGKLRQWSEKKTLNRLMKEREERS